MVITSGDLELLDMSQINKSKDPIIYAKDEKHQNEIDDFKRLIEVEHEIDLISSGGGYQFGRPAARDFLAYYYKALRPKDRYRITIDTYTIDGYFFPKRMIIGLKKIKPNDYLKDFPKKYSDQNLITVYRASLTEPCLRTIKQALKTELSWTIKKEVAKHFQDMNTEMGLKSFLYKGIIDKKDIIAYIDGEEWEVLQHNSIKNIEQVGEF